MSTTNTVVIAEPMVLRDIPYELYVALRDVDANRRKKMTYYDGMLEILSPENDRASRLVDSASL